MGGHAHLPEPAEAPEPVDFDWRAARAIFRDVRAPNPRWWTALRTVGARTLLLHGELSHVSGRRLAEVAASIPDCRLVEIPGAGHLIHDEHPGEFLAVVEPFLG